MAEPTNEERIATLRARSPFPNFVLPDYDDLSITQVAPFIRASLGQSVEVAPSLKALQRPWKRVVLLILDAFGYRLMEKCLNKAPALAQILDRGHCLPLTSTFPSTTTVALTAIYTGLTPARHTITGHMMFMRELGMEIDVLRYSPVGENRREVLAERGIDVHRLFPMHTVFEPLSGEGIRTLSITRRQFMNTALGWLHHVGAGDVQGYLTGADMCVLIRQALAASEGPTFIAAYWDVVDQLSHEYMPFSEHIRAAVAQIFYSIQQELLEALTDRQKEETLLLITADHGQTQCLPHEAVLLLEQPMLTDTLLLPASGQGRAAYLYPRFGMQDEARALLAEHEEQLLTLTRAEAQELGLFGDATGTAWLDTRIGDLIAVAKNGSQLMRPHVERRKLHPTGHHGSLTEEEMLVPLIALPLSAW